MRRHISRAAAIAAALCLGGAAQAQTEAPAGEYALDPTHASLVFRVDHLGFSKYTARFTKFDAALRFDPEDPTAARVEATVDVASLETDYPGQELDFDATLTGGEWLDAAQFPQMRFVSTVIEPTDENSAQVTGEFTMMGVTRPVTLDVTFNGGYAGVRPYDPQARVGYSARGVLKRSEFGLDYGLPPPGTSFGVGDEVEIQIEAEFLGPKLPPEE